MNLRKISVKILYEIFYKCKEKSLKTSFEEHIFNENIKENRDIICIKKNCYGVVRNRLFIDFVISEIGVKKNKTNKFVLTILQLAIFEILFVKNFKDFAVVNEACNTAKDFKLNYSVGFINATLKKFLASENSEKILKRKIKISKNAKSDYEHIAIRYSYPEKLVEYLAENFGLKNAVKFCIWNNREPELCVRTNNIKISSADLKKLFLDLDFGIKNLHFADDKGFFVRGINDLKNFEPFVKGYFFIQDEGSQLVGHIVNPQAGEYILDACASPGGKLCNIATTKNNKTKILACEIYEDKIVRIKQNITKLGLKNIEFYITDFLKFEKKQKFDKVLVDAPCSGLGVLNRHLEGKFIDKDFCQFAEIQKQMLDKATTLLTENGFLIYSVCTISREETDDVVKHFLEKNKNFAIDDIKKYLPKNSAKFLDKNGCLKILPFEHKMSGFYCARFKKLNIL